VKPLATVLYEDSKTGKEFPLHHLLMRMVEDDIDGQTWLLRKLVRDNPRNGIDKVLADVRVTSLIAGAGRLFVLVDRDRIIAHVNQNAREGEPRLAHDASDDQIVEAIRRTSDARGKLRVFFLHRNMEDLIAAIEDCAPGLWEAEIRQARNKDRLARNFVLTETAKAAMATLRACVRSHQAGLDALAKALGESIPAEAIE